MSDKLEDIVRSEIVKLPLHSFTFMEPRDMEEAAILCAKWHIHMLQLLVEVKDKEDSRNYYWLESKLAHLLGRCDENMCLYCNGGNLDV